MVQVYGIGGFILLVLNVWAIVSILSSGASTGGKVLWTILILILPLIGFLIWVFAGPRSRKTAV
ncbi:MAG: PLDc N-terminal domain-containing protein [Paracoccaceae bacterium]